MSRCRSCDRTTLAPILEHGALPLADGFLPIDQAGAAPRYPVTLALCEHCGLAQLLETVPRETLFGPDYPYFSSFSRSWLDHARTLAERLCAERSLGPGARIVEIASNDGYLLRHFTGRGNRVLGVEPAPGPAAAARALGLAVREAFFDDALGRSLAKEDGCADLVLALNVLAHVEDLHGFLAGVRALLAPEGLAVFEVGHLGALFDQLAYDTLYHEHLCIFSLAALRPLLARHGLGVRSVERIDSQGGSLRLFVGHGGAGDASVTALAAEERRRGLSDASRHRTFGQRVRAHSRSLRTLLGERAAAGRRIVAYGAAAKGTVLLNVAGIGTGLVHAVADRNPHKQGLAVPGVAIPIVAPEALRDCPPDDLLILPWNLRREIRTQEAWIGMRGGAYLVPLPKLAVEVGHALA